MFRRIGLIAVLASVASCGGSVDPSASSESSSSSSSSTSTSSSTGGGDGTCTTSADCADGQGCLYDDAACTAGTCHSIAYTDCGPGQPVCACDGTLEENGCLVPEVGSYTRDDSCFPATFACGSNLQCQRGAEYCASANTPPVDQSSCQPLDDACKEAGATCECFEEVLGCGCDQDAYGNFTISCSG